MKLLKYILNLFTNSNIVSTKKTIPKKVLKYKLSFEISSIDTGPDEIRQLLPIKATIIDKKESPDGGEYYLAILLKPINFNGKLINYFIVGGRMVGQGISPEMKNLYINIAYVTDNKLVDEKVMDFEKAEFFAIGFATASE